MMVRTAAMIPETVKKPSWVFFINYLFQQRSIIQRRTDMNECCYEESHPDRYVDDVPDRK
jgi:hypothetical protein